MQLEKNYIQSTFRNVYQVEQGQLDNLLKHCTKLGSNYQEDKWNYDVYLLDRNTVILTGCNNDCGQKLNKDFVQVYDKKVEYIMYDNLLGTVHFSIEQVIQEFVFTINNASNYPLQIIE